MKVDVLLIDDDTDSRLVAATFIEKYFPDIVITGQAGSVTEGIEMVEALRPDLIFLDVELPDGTGFDLLRAIKKKHFEVIFITAFNKYAIEAFRFSAIDYLLKPLSISELREALTKAKERLSEKMFEKRWASLAYNLEHQNKYERRLTIAAANGFVFVDVKDIVRCESNSNYTEFHFATGKKMTSSKNLGYYEELLPPEKFFRIHHSHLINIDFLNQYVKGGGGGTVIMRDGSELDVSQRKKDDFLQKVIAGRDKL